MFKLSHIQTLTDEMPQTIWLHDCFWNLLNLKSIVPSIIKSSLNSEGIVYSNFIDIEENEWKYLDGKRDFGECMADIQKPKCTSIFDPEPKKNG